jgi:hypothetical protein
MAPSKSRTLVPEESGDTSWYLWVGVDEQLKARGVLQASVRLDTIIYSDRALRELSTSSFQKDVFLAVTYPETAEHASRRRQKCLPSCLRSQQLEAKYFVSSFSPELRSVSTPSFTASIAYWIASGALESICLRMASQRDIRSAAATTSFTNPMR